ncbi:MAG: hypothetical protein ACRDJH_14845 [Thermomicrobiales bacterium]
MATRRFWRIVLSDPPTAWDFTSNAAKGLPVRRGDPTTRRLWEGVSVYDQRRYARRMALRAPHLGHFLAELHLPADAPILAERTTKSHGHYTLWGDPAFLLGCVVDIMPTSAETDHEER